MTARPAYWFWALATCQLSLLIAQRDEIGEGGGVGGGVFRGASKCITSFESSGGGGKLSANRAGGRGQSERMRHKASDETECRSKRLFRLYKCECVGRYSIYSVCSCGFIGLRVWVLVRMGTREGEGCWNLLGDFVFIDGMSRLEKGALRMKESCIETPPIEIYRDIQSMYSIYSTYSTFDVLYSTDRPPLYLLLYWLGVIIHGHVAYNCQPPAHRAPPPTPQLHTAWPTLLRFTKQAAFAMP